MDDQPTHRRLVLAGAWSAAATLGVLFNSGLIQLRPQPSNRATAVTDFAHLQRVQGYTTAAAVIVALLVLRLFPRTGWAWLLLAGSVLALPLPLSVMDRHLFDGIPQDLVTIAVTAATGLALLGVLGAAGWAGSLGAAGFSGVLAGAAIAMPSLGVLAILATSDRPPDIGWLLVGLGWLGVLGAAGAVVAARRAPGSPSTAPSTPSVRVLVCGLLAAVPPLLVLWVTPGDVARLLGEDVIPLDVTPANPGSYYLVIGLAMAALGLALAFVAGRRILLGTCAAGLAGVALGSSGVIIFAVLRDHPALLVTAAIGGAAAGWLVGLTRWRAWFSALGLTACGLTALITGYPAGARTVPRFGQDLLTPPAVNVFGLLLVLIGVAATVSAVATTTPILTDRSWLPIAFGALAPALQTGIGDLVAASASSTSFEASVNAAVSAAAVLLLLTAAVTAAIAFWPRATEPAGHDDDPTVELEREVVWRRLPDDE